MIRLIKNELIKNFSLIKLAVVIGIMIIVSFTVVESNFSKTPSKSLINKSTVYQIQLQKYEEVYSKEPTNDNLYLVYLHRLNKDLESSQNKLTIYSDSWKTNIISTIREDHAAIAALQMIVDGYSKDSFTRGNAYQYYDLDEIKDMYNTIVSKRTKNLELLVSGDYVDFTKYQLEQLQNEIKMYTDQGMDDFNNLIVIDKNLIKIKKYIIDNDITDEYDTRIVASKELERLVNEIPPSDYEMLDKDIFDKSFATMKNYKNYEQYVSTMQVKKERYENEYKRLWYAMEKGVRLTNPMKDIISHFWSLSFFVIVMVVVLMSNIVSLENKSGAVKLLLSQGVNRFKILLSKFITTILITYFVFLLFFIIFIVMSALKGSIGDFFVRELIVLGTKPILIDYPLYLLSKIFIYGIPTIFVMSLVFLITVIRKEALIATITGTLLAVLSLIPEANALVITYFKMYFISISPTTYLSLPFFSSEVVIKNFNNSMYHFTSQGLGIIVLVVSTIVIYIIASIIYTKSDVRS